ncbi:MAG: galactokinase [Anaerolineales bacterium]|nr:galactokinase [Anaerolineales bacterium]
MKLRDKVIGEFERVFSESPTGITKSPGRVNLIGEHTDYNDGFVLPMAINFATWVALRPRNDGKVVITAIDLNESLEFDLDSVIKGKNDWREYIKGVAWALQQDGRQLTGWEGVFSGNVPIGAGLSSSAALELALARAFSLVSGFEWDPAQMALTCQKAENLWVGVRSGIMDQMISANGKKDFALLIDCRSLETKQVPLPQNTQIVILDTNTRRGLVDSAYNERREQCEEVARHFKVKALRDINLDQLETEKNQLEKLLYRRARHVVSENQRVLQAVDALSVGDAKSFGILMNASHISMRNDFEISRKEMDQMVKIAQDQLGCYGARMTGGGFGGCAVALVEKDHVETFHENVVNLYREQSGLDPRVYISYASDGTSYEPITG